MDKEFSRCKSVELPYLEQIETDNLQNPERSVEVPEVKATVNENL
jgi:hypothetical protein